MLFVMATILMIQLQSFHRLFLVFAVAPLAVIGVVMAMLPSGSPLGFVAILGVLALIGILVRNSVILIVQIEDLRKEGRRAWDAVVEATETVIVTLGLPPLAARMAERTLFSTTARRKLNVASSSAQAEWAPDQGSEETVGLLAFARGDASESGCV